MFVGDVRFKLKLEVEDCTGVGVFVMFEREYSYLFRKSCAKIFSESMKLPKVIFADACYILFLVIDIIVDIVFSIYFKIFATMTIHFYLMNWWKRKCCSRLRQRVYPLRDIVVLSI